MRANVVDIVSVGHGPDPSVIRGAYEQVLVKLAETIVVNHEVQRKLAGVVIRVYIEHGAEVDVPSLADAALRRWGCLCGPPLPQVERV